MGLILKTALKGRKRRGKPPERFMDVLRKGMKKRLDEIGADDSLW